MRLAVILLSTFFIIVFNLKSKAQLSLEDSLVAHYPFNSNALDISGNSNHGIVYGATLTSDRFLNEFAAYDFNGNEYIRFENDFDFPIRSVVYWIYVRSIDQIAGVLFNSDHPNLQEHLIASNVSIVNGEDILTMNTGSSKVEVPINTNEWYMLSTVEDGVNTSFYLNDSLINNLPTGNAHSLDGFDGSRIGCSRKRDRFFDGIIDDLRIYNRVLTQNEIIELYNLNPLSIESESEKNEFKVYPNPATKSIWIQNWGTSKITKTSIYSANGEFICERKLVHNILNIDFLPKGAYFLKINDLEKPKFLRFFKD